MKRLAATRKGITFTAIAIVAIVALGFGYHALNAKIAAQSKPAPIVFQPNDEVLGTATNTGQAATTGTTTVKGITVATSSFVGATTTPYVYSASTCGNDSAAFLCLADYYKKLTKNYGVEIAFADIKQRFTTNAEVVSECHPLMHLIGQEAAYIYPTVSDAYLHGDSFCWSGYYHGVMEGVVDQIGLSALPVKINSICADIPGKASYNFDYYNCVHGLGHGIMEVENDNVFSSLKTCDDLTGDWEQESCYGGIFMENIIAYDHNGTSSYLKSDDTLYPCDAVEDRYKGQCYLGQTSFALQENNYNFAATFQQCSAVAEPYRDICNQSMGRDIANNALHAADATKNGCWIATDPNDRTNCVIGAAKEIVSYYHADVQAKAFCSILDDTNKATCLSTTASYYTAF